MRNCEEGAWRPSENCAELRGIVARRSARARHLVAVVDADRRLGEQHLLRRHQVGLRRREHEDDAGRRQRAGDERRLQQRRHEDGHARQAAHELLVEHHEAAVAADADEVAAAARLQLVDGVAERRLEAWSDRSGFGCLEGETAHGGHASLVLERRVVLEAAGHAGVLVVEEEDADGGAAHCGGGIAVVLRTNCEPGRKRAKAEL